MTLLRLLRLIVEKNLMSGLGSASPTKMSSELHIQCELAPSSHCLDYKMYLTKKKAHMPAQCHPHSLTLRQSRARLHLHKPPPPQGHYEMSTANFTKSSMALYSLGGHRMEDLMKARGSDQCSSKMLAAAKCSSAAC